MIKKLLSWFKKKEQPKDTGLHISGPGQMGPSLPPEEFKEWNSRHGPVSIKPEPIELTEEVKEKDICIFCNEFTAMHFDRLPFPRQGKDKIGTFLAPGWFCLNCQRVWHTGEDEAKHDEILAKLEAKDG